jgi:hypothetical protein
MGSVPTEKADKHWLTQFSISYFSWHNWDSHDYSTLEQVQIVKEAWIDAAKAEGKQIPKPKYCPAIYQTVD